MKRQKYTITFTVELNKMLPSVGKLCDSINETMQGFGFSEKMFLQSEFPVEFSYDGEPLTEAQTTYVTTTITGELQTKFPTWNFKYKSCIHKNP